MGMYTPSLMGALGAVTIVWFIGYLVKVFGGFKEKEDRRIINRVCMLLSILIIAGFGFYVINSAVVNQAPNEGLDRSIIDQRTKDLNDRAGSALGGERK